MEKEMRALYVEGLATRGGPESCVDDPRGRGEALTGVRAGRAIEPRNLRVRGADVVLETEGNTADGAIASRWGAPRGPRTRACTESSCARTGRAHCLPVQLIAGAGRSGNAKAVSLG